MKGFIASIGTTTRVLFSVALATLAAAPASQAGLTNRWSFNSAARPAPAGSRILSAQGGQAAIIRGTGAFYTGSGLTLPGTTNGAKTPGTISAYVDLPNGLLSSKVDMSIEVWVTPIAGRDWSRVFDFGRCASAGDGLGAPGEWTGLGTAATPEAEISSDDVTLCFSLLSDLNYQRMALRIDGALETILNSNLPSTAGTRYHYVMTYRDGVGDFAASGGQFAWYRDGVLVGKKDVLFHLRALEDVNNWLGRSQWSKDFGAYASYDELRIYDHALSEAEIIANRDAGPDAGVFWPVANPDTVAMHRGEKARIAVLANDAGNYNPSGVHLQRAPQFGTAVVDANGEILYTHTTGAPAGDSFSYYVDGKGTSTPSAPAEVVIQFSNQLRVQNAPFNVPLTPPLSANELVPALPGLNFLRPTGIATPPGDQRRLFIIERLAQIQVVPDITAQAPTSSVFLDLNAMLAARNKGETIDGGLNDEQGLLGLAFHPNYANNGYFYIFYTVRKNRGNYYHRLARFQVSANNPSVADPLSESILFEIQDEEGTHDGGDLHFGPDGYLYVPMGDEGGAQDFSQNSQRIDKDFFSGILRLDVDRKPGSRAPNYHPAIVLDNGVARYAIPNDNPFIGATSFNGQPVNPAQVRTEFWAVGFRHPYKISFDSLTNELWTGDVGQDSYEEVDLVTRGGNYGWVYREGLHEGFKGPPPAGFSSIDPIYEYPHTGFAGDPSFKGNCVIGGMVYRGAKYPQLAGAYIFSDAVSGNIWALRRNNGQTTIERLAGESYIVGFGRDPSNDDMLLVDYDGGRILRLVVGAAANSFPETLSATKLFADLTDLKPNPGLLPYEPILSFWSDYAVKRRWLSVPNAPAAMNWSREGLWTFPTGTIAVKHFDLDTTRGDPSTRKRIETRLLVKNDAGSFGVSYRWNDAGTEANLVIDQGQEFPINIIDKGVAKIQTWHIPSRAECRTCHSPEGGHFLSLNTRQLNQYKNIQGFTGNQIDQFARAGFFTNAVDPINTLPRHLRADEVDFPVEARVRSALAVNCAYCHNPEGNPPPTWFAPPYYTLQQTKMINGEPSNNGGSPLNKIIVPGDLNHSIIYDRVTVTNGFTRMPPLASNELDQTTIGLLQEWITTALPNRQNYNAWRLTYFTNTVSPLGDPAADPDQDGATNQTEFLEGTDPNSARSFMTMSFSPTDSTIGILGFKIPTDRNFQVETSTDLVHWNLWDTAGNGGLASPGGKVNLSGPILGAKQFFRLKLSEN